MSEERRRDCSSRFKCVVKLLLFESHVKLLGLILNLLALGVILDELRVH